ncbi:MAG: cysteine desulfurase family protein, partial [Ignavibacteriales bacterium]|nr:cysteine desulfurase family protein [Ignavibacteriales bacterium]
MQAGHSIYLDNNASTLLLPAVADFLSELIRHPPANPSSPHARGAEARRLVETSRSQLASALNCLSDQLYFVSSGTEANNMALSAALSLLPERPEIIISTVEHSSIRACANALRERGIKVVEVGVDECGRVVARNLERLVTWRTALVSIQLVNNETGVVHDVKTLRDIAHSQGALFHCDAAQALGKMHLDLDLENFDLASFTAHKINGPQGVGALFAKSRKLLRPVIVGGGQENHLRGGTENLLGIAAFGLAADVRRRSLDLSIREMTECRDLFERSVLRELPSAKVNGVIEERVCNTSNIHFPGVDGRMLVARLDEKGISCSQSSACTSSDPRPSHVLVAMGLTEVAAYESVRFSFGVQNSR